MASPGRNNMWGHLSKCDDIFRYVNVTSYEDGQLLVLLIKNINARINNGAFSLKRPVGVLGFFTPLGTSAIGS